MAETRADAARSAKVTAPDISEAGLEQILKRRISEQGPLKVSQYMEAALYHPQFGYYVTAKPIGATGDFVTGPEISQMFGELIGLWCVQAWWDMGRPARFHWIELGPGRGTLMQDALRAAHHDPQFVAAAQICLVEKNAHLKACQAEALSTIDRVKWYAAFEEIQEGPSIVIANEFFDCLPIDQFVFHDKTWAERKIGLDASGKFAFQISTEPAAAADIPNRLSPPKDGDIVESSPAAIKLMQDLADCLHRSTGRALIIDYGYQGADFGDTLQAVSRHKFADVLEAPGQVDITAHVDFSALTEAAKGRGVTVDGTVGQGKFLSALGLEMRADALKARATSAQARAITQSANRLIDPNQMGRLFKALSLSSPQLPAPPGFAVRTGTPH